MSSNFGDRIRQKNKNEFWKKGGQGTANGVFVIIWKNKVMKKHKYHKERA